jgi:hypothetical protein
MQAIVFALFRLAPQRPSGGLNAKRPTGERGQAMGRNENKMRLPQMPGLLQEQNHAPHLVVSRLWQDYIL